MYPRMAAGETISVYGSVPLPDGTAMATVYIRPVQGAPQEDTRIRCEPDSDDRANRLSRRLSPPSDQTHVAPRTVTAAAQDSRITTINAETAEHADSKTTTKSTKTRSHLVVDRSGLRNLAFVAFGSFVVS